MKTNTELENVNVSQIVRLSEQQEANMNIKLQNRDLWSNRYNMHMSVRNFLDKDWVDFSFFRWDLDPNVVREMIEAAGFNGSHPDYSSLSSQAHQSFKLGEIAVFLGCLSSLEMTKFNITPAVLQVSDLAIKQENTITVTVGIPSEEFFFSELDDFSLPFEIVGSYNPYS